MCLWRTESDGDASVGATAIACALAGAHTPNTQNASTNMCKLVLFSLILCIARVWPVCSTAGLLTSSLSCSLPIPKNSDVLARKFSFFRGPRGFLILGERRKCGDSKLTGCEVLVTSHFRRRHSSASVQDSHLFPFSSGTNEYPHQTPLLLIRAQRYYFFLKYANFFVYIRYFYYLCSTKLHLARKLQDMDC